VLRAESRKDSEKRIIPFAFDIKVGSKVTEIHHPEGGGFQSRGEGRSHHLLLFEVPKPRFRMCAEIASKRSFKSTLDGPSMAIMAKQETRRRSAYE
jgi:hypothetical protein